MRARLGTRIGARTRAGLGGGSPDPAADANAAEPAVMAADVLSVAQARVRLEAGHGRFYDRNYARHCWVF